MLHQEKCNCQSLILSAIYLTSTHLARGRQDDSPDWLRYSSGKGAGFFWQNSSKSLANLSGRMMTLACWYPITQTHNAKKSLPARSLARSLTHLPLANPVVVLILGSSDLIITLSWAGFRDFRLSDCSITASTLLKDTVNVQAEQEQKSQLVLIRSEVKLSALIYDLWSWACSRRCLVWAGHWRGIQSFLKIGNGKCNHVII